MKTLVSGSKRSDEIYRKTLEEQLTTANGKEESESILSAYIRQVSLDYFYYNMCN